MERGVCHGQVFVLKRCLRRVGRNRNWGNSRCKETPVSQVCDNDQTEPVTMSLQLAALLRDTVSVGSLLFTYSHQLFTCQ